MGREFVVVVREYDPNRDLEKVGELEKSCQVGSLLVDLMGDPLARIRQSPSFHMLVAEIGNEHKEIVGMIRGTIKMVTRGNNAPSDRRREYAVDPPENTTLAFVSGLRVSPFYRRMGIGLKLVQRLEEWFRRNDAVYAYLQTESNNDASVKLFTEKCGYSKFRTPTFLVHPVFNHRVAVSHRVSIIRLTPSDAELLYLCRFSSTEFFPSDIGSILNNKLSLGTFLALPRGKYSARSWPGSTEFLSEPPGSWAILSVWNSKDVYRLQVRGTSRFKRTLAKTSRFLDAAFPFLKIPSFPDVFRPFAMHFMYGIGGEGPDAAEMVEALCCHAHNLAGKNGCAVVASEVASCEPLRDGIPHWKILSPEDLWCLKRLRQDGSGGDWATSPPGLSIFVDPREI
ncbi:PREDICTED: probable N-acetyltransferase HLS1 [Tarenaya hassleriana]|uniref:probable N-acetyltransferase HLS1 n=1 Tax=Tarenaya hassleriana TaxID=28532 RepID=UPI00053C1686|nr:PREDICTED: probable N-acetyltransferase HLS1 [Tarenaya hassleriana]